MNAINDLAKVREAIQQLKQRTGCKAWAVGIRGGQYQLQKVTYVKAISRVEVITTWLDFGDLLTIIKAKG